MKKSVRIPNHLPETIIMVDDSIPDEVAIENWRAKHKGKYKVSDYQKDREKATVRGGNVFQRKRH